MEFEAVIGLEVHAQLLTETKIFCGCSTRFGATPNENTCPVCLGLPGALPVLNEKVVDLALRASLALDCEIPPVSVFARKNYFYPDLPKGYQISQFDRPLAVQGQLAIASGDVTSTIRIKRLHLEEDAGKLIHEGVEEAADAGYVDLNRAGVPLIEIVSEPDLRSPEEAYRYLTELKAILRYCRVSSANMEEGNLRCDANISLRPKGSGELGTKVEIKNLNSFKNVQKALEYEIGRQANALRSGETIAQETRLYNADQGQTEAMRSKEEAHDYRYFPEPDLLPVRIASEKLREIEAAMPELPRARRERFVREFHLSSNDAAVLAEERSLADYYEEAAELSRDPKQTANWILRDLLKHLKESNRPVEESPVQPGHLAGLIDLIRNGAISGNQGKEVFEEMWISGKEAAEIVKARGISQISGEEEISVFVDRVLAENPDLVSRYKQGEAKLAGVLVGQIMKMTGGKANPALASRLIKERLG